VLLDHFTRHLYPRALEIEKELDAGARLSDWEMAHVNEVLEDMKLLRPLIERHPEHQELVAGVASLYAAIARRVSHCFVMDVPSYAETLIVTDAAINIAPTLEDKVHIVQNAIDLAHAMRFPEVRVAILSAMETVNPKVPSTIEAAALCKMADRGQITGAILDGPLALDNAINLESVRIKKIDSPVAGRANVLVVPDLEAGNMLAKSLSFLAGADAAGIVLGARVPIILTSRADSVTTRLASCGIAALVANARREATNKAVL
jgi:phosphate acetyltransferase